MEKSILVQVMAWWGPVRQQVDDLIFIAFSIDLVLTPSDGLDSDASLQGRIGLTIHSCWHHVIQWCMLPLQCRRQGIRFEYDEVINHSLSMGICGPSGWSFLWCLFMVELVFRVIVVIWVVPLGVAVSWAPCFEWGKTCFFMIVQSPSPSPPPSPSLLSEPMPMTISSSSSFAGLRLFHVSQYTRMCTVIMITTSIGWHADTRPCLRLLKLL